MEEIRNKVAESGIITIDLEQYYPTKEVVIFDIKDYLFMGLILKEKDFREALKTKDWSVFQDKVVGITCSADAIIPLWAYMLVATHLQPFAAYVVVGNEEETLKQFVYEKILQIDAQEYLDKRVVIKGCGDKDLGAYAYTAIARKLLPVVKSLMYGEPCSTVPVYKKR
ncbi:MAG: DUF2480 family protein [Niabella sp.]